jgi:rare lipoprotein A (peptidoglycan hydrolase)
MNVRGHGARLYGVAVAVLMTIGFIATQTATGQDASVSMSSDQRLAFGEVLKVRGQVAGASAGHPVRLEYAPRGKDFRVVKRGETGAEGKYVLRHRPRSSGSVRVLTGGATASRVRTVRVRARIATAERKHVKHGDRVRVRGRLKPGFRGRTVRIQQRKGRRWVTIRRDRTEREGRFAASWRVRKSAGRYRTRVVFRGDRRNPRVVDKTRLFVYRAGQASYYGPGLYGNRTACGQTLTPSTLGVANRWLPCGTRVTFRYHGRTVTVPVIDRGPFHGSRIWDLTYATKQKLGFGSTGVVWSTR